MKSKLFHEFIRRLNELPQISGEVIEHGHEKTHTDTLLQISCNGKKEVFGIVFKSSLLPATINLSNTSDKSNLYLANYISAKARKLLQQNNISYVDNVGNMFISGRQVYIFNETNTSGRTNLQTQNTELGKAGLQVVYQFLTNSDVNFLNQPYRTIADQALVTIDTVRRTMQYLLKEKLILQKDVKDYVFNDKKRILEEWVYGYNKKFKPKLMTQRFRAIGPKVNWQAAVLPPQTQWGGIRAAEILTNRLIANKYLMYSGLGFAELLPELMRCLPVVRDSAGELLIRENFWKTTESDENLKQLIVHPILIYADLISDADPRAQEVAQTIYKDYVENNL